MFLALDPVKALWKRDDDDSNNLKSLHPDLLAFEHIHAITCRKRFAEKVVMAVERAKACRPDLRLEDLPNADDLSADDVFHQIVQAEATLAVERQPSSLVEPFSDAWIIFNSSKLFARISRYDDFEVLFDHVVSDPVKLVDAYVCIEPRHVIIAEMMYRAVKIWSKNENLSKAAALDRACSKGHWQCKACGLLTLSTISVRTSHLFARPCSRTDRLWQLVKHVTSNHLYTREVPSIDGPDEDTILAQAKLPTIFYVG